MLKVNLYLFAVVSLSLTSFEVRSDNTAGIKIDTDKIQSKKLRRIIEKVDRKNANEKQNDEKNGEADKEDKNGKNAKKKPAEGGLRPVYGENAEQDEEFGFGEVPRDSENKPGLSPWLGADSGEDVPNGLEFLETLLFEHERALWLNERKVELIDKNLKAHFEGSKYRLEAFEPIEVPGGFETVVELRLRSKEDGYIYRGVAKLQEFQVYENKEARIRELAVEAGLDGFAADSMKVPLSPEKTVFEHKGTYYVLHSNSTKGSHLHRYSFKGADGWSVKPEKTIEENFAIEEVVPLLPVRHPIAEVMCDQIKCGSHPLYEIHRELVNEDRDYKSYHFACGDCGEAIKVSTKEIRRAFSEYQRPGAPLPQIQGEHFDLGQGEMMGF